jgi:hypothetical protein
MQVFLNLIFTFIILFHYLLFLEFINSVYIYNIKLYNKKITFLYLLSKIHYFIAYFFYRKYY